MQLKVSPTFLPVIKNKKRYTHLWGGRGRGATHFATEYALFLTEHSDYFNGGFLRATYNGIKTGLWKAFNERMDAAVDRGDLDRNNFAMNLSDLSARNLLTGNTIISKGFRKSDKTQTANMKGLEGLTFAIIDEAEEITEEEFNKFDDTLRTNKSDIQILLLFNPPHKNHWLIKNYYDVKPYYENGREVKGWFQAIPREIEDFLSIHSTYHNNAKNLNESYKKKYQNYNNPESPFYNLDFYYRDVLGLISEGKKGRIFMNVRSITDEQFDRLDLDSFIGIDFGFVDPNACVRVKYSDGKLYVKQLVYQTQMTKNELYKELKYQKVQTYDKIAADSAEPDTISEMQGAGFSVSPAIKGPGSIDFGYRELLNCTIYYTASSKELEFELENHCWQQRNDIDENDIKMLKDVPEDKNNHAIDALRYAYTTFIKRPNESFVYREKTNTFESELSDDGQYYKGHKIVNL